MSNKEFNDQTEYTLLDSGNLKKLEQIGRYMLIRPALNAFWEPHLSTKEWEKADAVFERNSSGGGNWTFNKKLPESWNTSYAGFNLLVKPTPFGHIGFFAEQKENWEWLKTTVKKTGKLSALNLFAYSGGSSLAMAEAGADVCHVDAAKGMVDWARENLNLNPKIENGIRWIVEDVHKFLSKEIKRNNSYPGIVLDPPSFGRGPKGNIWKIEKDLIPLLEKCRTLMGKNPKFILLSMHSNGYSPNSLSRILKAVFKGKVEIDAGEMLINESTGNKLSAGIYARLSYI